MSTWETVQWLRFFQDILQEGRERQWRALWGLRLKCVFVCICCVLGLYPAAEEPLWHSECVVCWAWSAWPDHWSPRSQCQTGTDSPPPSPCCRDTQRAQHHHSDLEIILEATAQRCLTGSFCEPWTPVEKRFASTHQVNDGHFLLLAEVFVYHVHFWRKHHSFSEWNDRLGCADLNFGKPLKRQRAVGVSVSSANLPVSAVCLPGCSGNHLHHTLYVVSHCDFFTLINSGVCGDLGLCCITGHVTMWNTLTDWPLLEVIQAALEVNFPGSDQNVFPRFLNENFGTGVGLVQQSHPMNQLWHVTWSANTKKKINKIQKLELLF